MTSRLLLDMHRDPLGMVTLNEGRIARFVASDDHDYDPIRRMAQAAAALRCDPHNLPQDFGYGERERIN